MIVRQKRGCTLIICCLLTTLSYSQDIFQGVSHIGYTEFYPHFGRKNVESLGPWKGFEFNGGNMFISYAEGSVRQIGADSTIASIPARTLRFSGGLEKRFTIGKTNLYSIECTPHLLIGGALTQIPNKIVESPITSFGLRLSPGIKFRVSHLSFSVNYDAGTYLNTNLTGQNWEHNTLRRFSYFGGLNFTLALNSGFDLLAPKELTAKGYNVSKETYTREGRSTTDWQRGIRYTEIITTTVTKYSPGERTLQIVAPFWGIGPMYDFIALRNRQASTSAFGLSTGLRFSFFQLDAFWGQGKVGLKDQYTPKEILLTYPQLRDFDFSSQINMTYKGLRAGVNISKFFALSNFESTDKNFKKMRNGVPFMRLHGNFTYGWVDFKGTPEYSYTGAGDRLYDFQNYNAITPSAENNAQLLPENTTFTGWGANLEIGYIFFQATWYKYKDAAVANHMHYSIGAHIPLIRVVNSVRAKLSW